jgi:hypothetical protein
MAFFGGYPQVIRARCALVLSIAWTAGCGGPAAPASTPADKPPAQMPAQFRSKCDAANAPMRPLVVEWPAPDRASLEASAHRGQLVV